MNDHNFIANGSLIVSLLAFMIALVSGCRGGQVMSRSALQQFFTSRWLDAGLITLTLLAYTTLPSALILAKHFETQLTVCQKIPNLAYAAVSKSKRFTVICQILAK